MDKKPPLTLKEAILILARKVELLETSLKDAKRENAKLTRDLINTNRKLDRVINESFANTKEWRRLRENNRVINENITRLSSRK